MSREEETRLVLNLNYQGFSSLPVELLKSRNLIHEIYLKFNCIKRLVMYIYRSVCVIVYHTCF